VRIELIGQIENLVDSKQNVNFLTLAKDLEPPGSLTDNMAYDFLFTNVEKQFESYNGVGVRVRYCVNVIVNRGYNKQIEEEEFIVHNVMPEPILNPPAELEVGIEGKLQLRFELDSTKFHLEDCIMGRVIFN
jgi:vacuolar protein sorting-associated protein 26